MPTDNDFIKATTLAAGSTVNITFHVAYPHRVSHNTRGSRSMRGRTHAYIRLLASYVATNLGYSHSWTCCYIATERLYHVRGNCIS